MLIGADLTVRPVAVDCRAYRLIRAEWVMSADVDGVVRPSSQSFTDSSIDGFMSVFLSDEMELDGKTVDDLLKCYPAYPYCCWWTAVELGELGQVVVRQKVEDFPGHAGVRSTDGSRRTQSVRRRMATAATWHQIPQR